jgi:hypothetical protein
VIHTVPLFLFLRQSAGQGWRECAERIEEYSSGLFIGLGCFGKSELKSRFRHLEFYGSGRARFERKDRLDPNSAV